MPKYLYLLLLFSYNVSAINHSGIITGNDKITVEFYDFEHDGKKLCSIDIKNGGDLKKGGTFFSLTFNPYTSPVSFGLFFNNVKFRDFKKDAILLFHDSKSVKEATLYSVTAETMDKHNDSRLRVDFSLRNNITYKDAENVFNYFIDKPIQINYGDNIYKIPNLKSKKDEKEINAFKACMKQILKKSQEQTKNKLNSTSKHSIGDSIGNTKDTSIISNDAISNNKYIAKDSLFCLSEQSLKHQSKLLSSGVMEFASQCFSAAQDIEVVLDDFKIFNGTAKVIGVDSGKEMWTTSESLIDKPTH